MADRYSYIPSIGIFVAGGWGLDEWLGKTRARLPVVATAGALSLAACAILTHRQVKTWHDNYSVFSHALSVTADNAVAHCELGTDLRKAGKAGQGDRSTSSVALACDPSYVDAYYNLGVIFWEQGQYDWPSTNIGRLCESRRGSGWAHSSLGEMLWAQGRKREAIQEYTEALRLSPDYPETYVNLGTPGWNWANRRGSRAFFTGALN